MSVPKQSIELFRRAASELPAYADFLKKHNFDPDSLDSGSGFESVPPTSKDDYLKKYSYSELIWKEDQDLPLWFCSTSGSTGEPYYFPRKDSLAWRGSLFIENFLKYRDGHTLVLLCFGMGVWIGGVITLRSFEQAIERAHLPVSLLPVGYNKQEALKALRKLSPSFDHTIIVGYPPFVKELVDGALHEDIDLKKLGIRFLFAAEAFTETFRQYLCSVSGVEDPLLDTLNLYGSADMGAMANETPLSILARRLALDEPELYMKLFGQIEKTPTLAQYNHELIEFEGIDGELLLTSDGALPLIRYAIGDHGGVFEYDELLNVFKQHGVDLEAEAKKAGISSTISKKPFVYVYERVDLSASLHGIIIYSEFVKDALLKTKLQPYFSQKFTMSTKTDISHNQFLQINLELQPDVEPNEKLKTLSQREIVSSLRSKSSEFAEVARNHPNDLVKVVLWANGDPRYFAPGTKQKWVEKA